MAYRNLKGRDATISDYYVRTAYPLIFWTDCISCDGEFRRERGFKFDRSWLGRGCTTHYMCKSCAPTIEDAADIVKEYLQPPKTDRPEPMLPPPPPARCVCGNTPRPEPPEPDFSAKPPQFIT